MHNASPSSPDPREKIDLNQKRCRQMVNPHTSALVLDAEMRIQHLTLPARRLLEYNPAQAPAHSFLHHVHDKNLFQVMRDVADMVCHGKAKASWMLRLRTGRGRWRWYKASAHNHLPHSAAIVVDLRDLHEL